MFVSVFLRDRNLGALDSSLSRAFSHGIQPRLRIEYDGGWRISLSNGWFSWLLTGRFPLPPEALHGAAWLSLGYGSYPVSDQHRTGRKPLSFLWPALKSDTLSLLPYSVGWKWVTKSSPYSKGVGVSSTSWQKGCQRIYGHIWKPTHLKAA